MPLLCRFGVIAVLAASCAGVKVGPGGNERDGSAADLPVGGTGGRAGAAGGNGTGGRPQAIIDAAGEGGGCNSGVTCNPAGGQYCGVIGNGCFGTIDCGGCPTGQLCEGGLCVG